MKHNLISQSGLLLLASLGAVASNASGQALLTQVDSVRPSSIRSLLGQPDGLEVAAENAKHVFIHIHNPQYQQMDLQQIYAESSIIVIGKCTDRRTSWDSNTNFVTTSYAVHADRVVKGSVTQPLIVTVQGGVAAFSDVAIAEVRSTEYDSLSLGAEAIFFLVNSDAGVTLTNGVEGLFLLDLTTGKVISAAVYDKYPHRLTLQQFGQLPAFLSTFPQQTAK